MEVTWINKIGVATVRVSRMMIGKTETNNLANRRKNEKNELRLFNQKHVFRVLKEESKNTEIVAHVQI